MSSYRNAVAGFIDQVRQVGVLLLVVFLIRTFGFGLYQVPTGSMETTMLIGERFFADKMTYLFRKPRHSEIIAFNDPLFTYSQNYVGRLFQDYVWGPSNWTKRVIGLPGDELKDVIEDGKPVIYRNGVKLDEPYVNQYPLAAVMKMTSAEISKSIEQEALELIAQRRLNPADFSQFIAHRMGYFVDWRSFDPSVSFDKQPFHRIKSDLLVKDRDNSPLLKLPGSPIRESDPSSVYKEGENYWNGSDEFYVKLNGNQYWVMGDNRQGSKDSRFIGPIDGRLIHGRILFRIWSLDSDENWWILDLLKHPLEFWTRIRWSRFFQSVA